MRKVLYFTFGHSKIQDAKSFEKIIKFRNYLFSVNFSRRCLYSESTVHRSFPKQVFLKTLQYSQGNISADPYSLLLRNSYGGCSWILAAANTIFQLNLVFIYRLSSCNSLHKYLFLSIKGNHLKNLNICVWIFTRNQS